MSKKVGYLRVSTREQRPDRQADALADHCILCEVEFASAGCLRRPVYERLVETLQAGDTLVVASLDRAFRSTVDAVTEAERLIARGVNFKVLNLNVDTATADGMLAYTIIAAVATHERMRISERTREGLAAARRRGARLGRPPKLTPEVLQEVRSRLGVPGETLTALAREYGVAPWSLSRALKRAEGVT